MNELRELPNIGVRMIRSFSRRASPQLKSFWTPVVWIVEFHTSVHRRQRDLKRQQHTKNGRSCQSATTLYHEEHEVHVVTPAYAWGQQQDFPSSASCPSWLGVSNLTAPQPGNLKGKHYCETEQPRHGGVPACVGLPSTAMGSTRRKEPFVDFAGIAFHRKNALHSG